MRHEDESLLREFRQAKCEWCGKPPPSDPHHLWPRQMGSGSRMDCRFFMVSLCRRHHREAEEGKITRADLCEMALQREIWLLSRIPKESAGRFAELMTAYNYLLREQL